MLSCKKEKSYENTLLTIRSQYEFAAETLKKDLQATVLWPNINELVGLRFPSFIVKDIQGKIITEKSFSGKYKIMNMWFVGCRACILEIPSLEYLKIKYPNLEILSFCRDGQESLNTYLHSNPINFVHIPDSRILIESKFPLLGGYPCNVLVDAKGIIRYIGGSVDDPRDKENFISILNESL
jgi:hypothetical protein